MNEVGVLPFFLNNFNTKFKTTLERKAINCILLKAGNWKVSVLFHCFAYAFILGFLELMKGFLAALSTIPSH